MGLRPLPRTGTRAPPFPGGKGGGLLSQRHPGPEPTQEFEKGKGEEDPVAQALAATRGTIGSRVVMGRQVSRGGEVGEEGQTAEDHDAGWGLGAPVVDQPDLLRHREGYEVGEPDEEEDDGEERGGGRGR